MKKQLSIMMALAVLAIGIITSCKKDPIPNNNEQNDEQIHFGDTTGMIVTTYDSIMSYDESWRPFVLDLNGDGTDDIKIETIYDGPLAIGEFQTLTLHCLYNQTELLADSVAKESYSHRETTIDTTGEYTITTNSSIFSTCDKIEENDPVHVSNVFEAFAFDRDDLFDIDAHFQSGKVALFRQDVRYSLADPDDINHTVSINAYESIYSCWNFPTDEEKYIGFRITKNGNSRYGWLKIKLHPTWGGKVVDTELIETAIQK